MTKFARRMPCLVLTLALAVWPALAQADAHLSPVPAVDKDSDYILAPDGPEIATVFGAALADAWVPEAEDIVTDLFAIAPHNPHLVLRTVGGERQVLMTAYVSKNKLAATVAAAGKVKDPKAETLEEALQLVGQPLATPQADWGIRYWWATPVPQLRQFCRGVDLSGEKLALRLRQYLGLAPEASYDYIVEVWVPAAKLFRPCPDPAISDRTCNLPDSHGGAYVGRVVDAAPEAHRTFFQGQWDASRGSYPLPWTALGYTYDWGDADNPVGGSEYVIAADASFEIASLATADAYCLARD